MTYLARIADAALNQPLLLSPDKAAVVIEVLAGRIGLGGAEVSQFEGSPVAIDASGKVKQYPFRVTRDGVGIVSILGSLVNRGAWVGAYSGLTSYEGIQHQIKEARNSPEVRAVLLDIQSPGGEAIGCFETAAMIRDLAAAKPVTAVVNGIAASGGYALASAAREIVTTDTGVSGSIGVLYIHADLSKRLEKEGIKPTIIMAGARKADGNPYEPLPDEVKSEMQDRIDGLYEKFIATVEMGRGERMTAAMIRATEARVYSGADAVKAGLADRVGSFESVLADLSRGERRTTSQKGKSMSETQGAPAAEANAGITQEQLNAAVAKATEDGKAQVKAEAETAVKADRERIASLDKLAVKVSGNEQGMKIIADAKSDGSTAADTALKLAEADCFAKGSVIGSIMADDASATAAVPASPGGVAVQTPQTPDGWKAEWEASADLQASYPKVEHYVSFKKAEAGGRVRILEGKAGK